MTKSQAKSRIEQLRKEINEHDRHYYVFADPVISDREYDARYWELLDLEAAYPDLVTDDSPTQRVSGEPTKAFQPARHAVPMLSLANTYNQEEVVDFVRRISELLGH